MTNDTNGCPDPRIPAGKTAPDELEMRIRSLEAERLRAVPPTPRNTKSAPVALVLELLAAFDDNEQED